MASIVIQYQPLMHIFQLKYINTDDVQSIRSYTLIWVNTIFWLSGSPQVTPVTTVLNEYAVACV